jgi:TRAP-type mannitol/chloroaromatic compound transport system permease large subunit
MPRSGPAEETSRSSRMMAPSLTSVRPAAIESTVDLPQPECPMKLGFDKAWFGILVAVNLQTAWLSPPVAMSAYFLKGVVPQWDLGDIYKGMMQFMGLQLFGLALIIIFPQIALWLPEYIYGK